MLLLILLGLKKCARDNNGSDLASSEQPSSSQIIEEDKDIEDRLLEIETNQMDNDGFDKDPLAKLVEVSYTDNYPTDYNLVITARNETKLYFYSAEGVE